jgi:membrane protease YdiL (CAAX protease family)
MGQEGLGGPSAFSGLYAETFAVWMVLFLILDLGATVAPVGEYQLLVLGLAMMLSLGALAWPVWRGVPWAQVRRDIGLTAGRRPAWEPWIGLGSYAMAFPLMVIGLLVMIKLLGVPLGPAAAGPAVGDFDPGQMPVHPIIRYAARPGWWGRFQVFLVVSLVAPVVEETVFRGVLYRHLRDLSARLGRLASFLVSATGLSFLFAVIHPQGLVAVPALMGLAFGLALAREWRGTLIPAMVAHGVNNGLLIGLIAVALAD